MSLIIAPVTIVDLALRVREYSMTVCPSQRPISFILRSILPFHTAIAMPESALPLASVLGPSAFIDVSVFLDDLSLFIIQSLGKGLRKLFV
jgi:hypothetical protein